MKIGIYGGTFDPVHLGHLIIAQVVREELALDKIVFIPSAIPPHKEISRISAPEIRWQMLQLAIQDNPYFDASRIEIDRPGISYTVNTLEQIIEQWQLASHELFLLLGADSLFDLQNWYKPEQILSLAQVIVFPRPGYDLSKIEQTLRKKCKMVSTPLIDISSSLIRERWKHKRTIRYLVTKEVHDFIQANQLYK